MKSKELAGILNHIEENYSIFFSDKEEGLISVPINNVRVNFKDKMIYLEFESEDKIEK